MDFVSSRFLIFLGTLILSLLITWAAIPSIIRVARIKKLYDAPSARKSHSTPVPSLGGIAIFAGFVISTGIFISYDLIASMQYVLVACVVLFFIGVKDDIVSIIAWKKLIGQIVAALVCVIPGNIYISNLHGLFGIEYINPILGGALTVFIIVALVNAFNLIDGVDGLASGIGAVGSIFFGGYFYLSGNTEYCIFSAGLIGALVAFMRFNYSRKAYKIFMGDTGSLLLGLLMSIQLIFFCQQNIGYTSAISLVNAPLIALSIVLLPLFDTARVFLIRIARGRSPFTADKNHIHHLLLKLGFKHWQVTLIMLAVQAAFIGITFILHDINSYVLLTILLASAIIFVRVLELLAKKYEKRQH